MLKHLKSDLPASLVVFFVALPLCLGIALASGAPLFSGIIAGIVGGVFVGAASGSSLGVSGPAAGLAVIVVSAIASLGSWQSFLLAVVLAGVFQVALGFLKAGAISHFFPSSVIKGMLAGIGLLIILKQIPHALGFDRDAVGDLSFFEAGGGNTFLTIEKSFQAFTPGAVLISLVSIAILLLWDQALAKRHWIFKILQGPMVVVAFGILSQLLYQSGTLPLSLAPDQLVSLPVSKNLFDFLGQFTHPDFSQIFNLAVWKVALVLAVVASLETLLCVEATDKLDPAKKITPANRELFAQGLGNIASGLLGGLPLTQVIVRSSANISFGAKSKLSAILHGFYLLISALAFATLLNQIPLASLAAILMMVGYKLAKPELFLQMFRLGHEQFLPFAATIVGILFTDMLTGISIGLGMGLFYTLLHNYRNSHQLVKVNLEANGSEVFHFTLAEEVSFLNKVKVKQELEAISGPARVVIDGRKSKTIAHDVVEMIHDFKLSAVEKGIQVETINFGKSVYT